MSEKLFFARHSSAKASRRTLDDFSGRCFLGVDAGSTTTKAVLIDEEGAILYSRYMSNSGNPLEKVREILNDLYAKLPDTAVLVSAGITGHGEKMLQTAYGSDIGAVETNAH